MFAYARDRGRRAADRRAGAAAAERGAHRRFDCGAPYMRCAGVPSYSLDRFDTPLTHPLATHAPLVDENAAALRAFHRGSVHAPLTPW